MEFTEVAPRAVSVVKCRFGRIEGKGNGLIANERVPKGELLFSELPFCWSLTDGGTSSSLSICAECGVKIIDGVDTVPCDNCSMNSCHDEYCCGVCKDEAWKLHHELLCGTQSIAIPMQGDQKNTGHQYLARKLLSMIILHAMRQHNKSGVAYLSKEELHASFDSLLSDVEKMKYTRCIHLHRGGQIMSDNMFKDLFESAYFDSHLRDSFETLRDIFLKLGACDSFLEFFDETFYDELMGMLLNNCQDVLLTNTGRGMVRGSALYKLYSKSNHACEASFENRALRTDAGLEKVGVNLFASRDIEMDEEILNCYLSQGTGLSIPKKERMKALAHYQFQCRCTMCQDEESVESDY